MGCTTARPYSFPPPLQILTDTLLRINTKLTIYSSNLHSTHYIIFMKLMILSDLHIGNGNGFDTFGWDPQSFIRHLDHLRNRHSIEKVVLNGDVFELFKYSIREIEKNHTELISYFDRTGCVYIKGNHDLLSERSIDGLTITNSSGQKIRIEHGHNADFLNGTPFGRFLCRVGLKLLQSVVSISFFRNLYFKLVELDDEVNHIPRKYNSLKYLQYAMRLLSTYDVVVLGHTHKIEAHKTYYLNHKKRYLNTGSCSLGRFQAVTLDTETLEYDTIKVSAEECRSAGMFLEFKEAS
jgi:predicted phosphodiesterase